MPLSFRTGIASKRLLLVAADELDGLSLSFVFLALTTDRSIRVDRGLFLSTLVVETTCAVTSALSKFITGISDCFLDRGSDERLSEATITELDREFLAELFAFAIPSPNTSFWDTGGVDKTKEGRLLSTISFTLASKFRLATGKSTSTSLVRGRQS
jgi:hypothetical protein